MKSKTLRRIIAFTLGSVMLTPLAFAACGDGETGDIHDGVIYEINDEGTAYMLTGTKDFKKTEFTVPATFNDLPVTVIADKAFMGCKTLESLVIPDTVTEIGAAAFKGCKSLEELTVPFVGASAGAEGEEALFGYFFGNKAFSNATKIYQTTQDDEIKAYIPNDLKSVTVTGSSAIKYGAFSACENITEIAVISASSVETNAFLYCDALASVYIASPAVAAAVTSAESCGGMCAMATSIFVADGITEVGRYISDTLDVLDGTANVGGKTYKVYGAYEEDGIFYRKNSGAYEIVGVSADFAEEEFAIPATVREMPVTSIRSLAFQNLGTLTTLHVSENLTDVGKDAFKGCSKLAKIYLESETIANALTGNSDFGGMFYYATDVLIPETITAPEIFGEMFNNTEEAAETVGGVIYNRYYGEEIWVRFEAEEAILSGVSNAPQESPYFVRGSHACSGDKYVGNFNVEGNNLKFVINSSATVRAKVAIRVSSLNNPNGNINAPLTSMYKLTVNGIMPAGYEEVVVVPSEEGKKPGGSYVDFVTAMFEIDLVKGENIVILDAGTATNNLDYIELVTMARLTWTPTENGFRGWD